MKNKHEKEKYKKKEKQVSGVSGTCTIQGEKR